MAAARYSSINFCDTAAYQSTFTCGLSLVTNLGHSAKRREKMGCEASTQLVLQTQTDIAMT